MSIKTNLFFYLMILIFAGIIISFFYSCTLGILEGDVRPLIALIVMWICILIMVKFLSIRFIKIEEIQRYFILAAIIHLGISTAILIGYYQILTCILFSCFYFGIMIFISFKEQIITLLFEMNILQLSFAKLRPRGLDIKDICYILEERPWRIITYLQVSLSNFRKLQGMLTQFHDQEIDLSFEIFNQENIESYIGISITNEQYDVVIDKLINFMDYIEDLFVTNDIAFKKIIDSEELERIYFSPLLNYKYSKEPCLVYDRNDENSFKLYNAGEIEGEFTVQQINFNPNQTFDLFYILKKLQVAGKIIEPFWFCMNVRHYPLEVLERKRYKLKLQFMREVRHVQEELKLENGKSQAIQLLSNSQDDPNDTANIFNFLLKSDYQKIHDLKQIIKEFSKGMEQGYWNTSFILVTSNNFLFEIKKFTMIEFTKLKKRSSLCAFRRNPIDGRDLNSTQIKNFLKNSATPFMTRLEE
ncbi:MAG: hypothetical protein ACTSX4_02890 [Candidatus Helarchaeota archaeon]